MQQWVTKVGYGNQKIGDKADIDQFWLKGELRITPQAQIEFLRRLYRGDLPFSERSMAIVKDIMTLQLLQPWQESAKFSKVLVPPLLLGQVCSTEKVSIENAC
jgi:beta-lactamase class D